MPRLTPGTPVSGPYSSYTAEQLAALETMKDRTYTLGIARAEFVNQVLAPDGSLSTDVEPMRAAVRESLSDLLAGDLTDPDTLESAKRAAERVRELADHLGQQRFLFVVDAELQPIVYFQCATAENPDLPAIVEDHEAHAAHLEEVGARITATIEDAHRRAAEERAAAEKVAAIGIPSVSTEG